jgi:hypothetical protein
MPVLDVGFARANLQASAYHHYSRNKSFEGCHPEPALYAGEASQPKHILPSRIGRH